MYAADPCLLPLIEPDQFRSIYGRIAGASRDEDLAALIDSADGLMADYCGYPFNDAGTQTLSSATYTLYYDRPGRDAKLLCLGVAPIVSVSDVRVDATRAYGSSTAFVEGTDFDVALSSGLLALLPGSSRTTWPNAYRATRVTFVGGYAETPAALLPVTASVVQALLDRPALQQQQTSSIGGISTTITDLENFLPAAVRAVLDSYKVCG